MANGNNSAPGGNLFLATAEAKTETTTNSMKLVKDVVQLISQYSNLFDCKLRCLNHEFKDMVDEVLPNIPNEIDYSEKKRQRQTNAMERQTNAMEMFFFFFACCGHCCGMVLFQQHLFLDWIYAIKDLRKKEKQREISYLRNTVVADEKEEKYGKNIELFCGKYLPSNGYIDSDLLELLCLYNRKEYARQLWKDERIKKSPFRSNYLASISMLDDLEFLEMVDESFIWTTDVVIQAIKNATWFNRWRNVSYLLFEGYTQISEAHTFCFQTIPKLRLFGRDQKGFRSLISLPNNRENVMRIMKQNGELLIYTKSFRKDKDVVMAAVIQNGLSLRYADESLRKDKEIVMIAMKQNREALKYADESLRKDKEFVMTVVKRDGLYLQYADESLRNDKEITMAAVKQNLRAY